jgi:5-formyltetrahydrofolate cyclo-ligase
MTDVPVQKTALRQRMRATLAATPPEDLVRASEAICRHLRAWPGYTRARAILLFLPMLRECDLSALAADAVKAGKQILIPCVDWQTGAMTPVRITDPAVDAPLDPRGVPCPRPDLPQVPLADVDLILVPGLSFDRRGGRLGRAAGFYDRLLSDPGRPPRTPVIGVGLEAQIVDLVPTEGHDRPMDGLVTENGLTVFEENPPGGPIQQ